MSKRTKQSKAADPALAGALDRRRAIVAGAVIVAVAGTLIVAAVLQTRPEADSQVELPEPVPDVETGETGLDSLPEEAPAAFSQSEPPPSVSDPMASRAAADLRRLQASGGDWTLQFASLCDRGRVRSLVASLEGQEQFYLVPSDDCFKLWWGRFATREQAIAARGVPDALSSLTKSLYPRRIAESLP